MREEWVIADPLSDPLCQMLAAEEEWGEIDALIETELAYQHVKSRYEFKD